MSGAAEHTTEGWLLGGRLRYRQPRGGFRSGIEPVLLAASVPARGEDRVLEAGCGAGAGLLCLAARIGGIHGTGVERDPRLADLAGGNFAANGFTALSALAADIETFGLSAVPAQMFDHTFANPPWHGANGTAPADPARSGAKRGGEKLGAWITALARHLRPGGTLSLMLAPAQLPTALAASRAAGTGSPLIFPFWPKEGRAAKLVLLQVRRGGRGPLRLLAGLLLHCQDGRFTPTAEAILRGGGGLKLQPDVVS